MRPTLGRGCSEADRQKICGEERHFTGDIGGTEEMDVPFLLLYRLSLRIWATHSTALNGLMELRFKV